MRLLLHKSTLRQAVPLGLLVALTGLPHVWLNTAAPSLLHLRLVVLVPLAIILAQVAVAWTPLAEGRSAIPGLVTRRDLMLFLPAPFLLGLLLALFVDPVIARIQPDYWPQTLAGQLAAMPWVGLFQPLVLVAAVYAFLARLTHSATAGMVAVVLVHQAAFYAHAQGLPSHLLLLGITATGLGALFQAWCYRRLGLPGLAWTGLVIAARHLLG